MTKIEEKSTLSEQEQIAEANRRYKIIETAPEMLAVLKSLRGIEAWIADPELKRKFQQSVYGVIEKAEGRKEEVL